MKYSLHFQKLTRISLLRRHFYKYYNVNFLSSNLINTLKQPSQKNV